MNLRNILFMLMTGAAAVALMLLGLGFAVAMAVTGACIVGWYSLRRYVDAWRNRDRTPRARVIDVEYEMVDEEKE